MLMLVRLVVFAASAAAACPTCEIEDEAAEVGETSRRRFGDLG